MEAIVVCLIFLVVLVVAIGIGKDKREKKRDEMRERNNRLGFFISNNNLVASPTFDAEYRLDDVVALDSESKQVVISNRNKGDPYKIFGIADI